MELWVVIYDNSEMYEDYNEWVEAVMSTEEKAKNYKPKDEIGVFNRIEHFVLDEPRDWRKIN